MRLILVIYTRPAVSNPEESVKLHALPRRRLKTKLAMFTVVALTLVMPATFLISESSLAEAPVSLGSAHSFAVFSKGVLTNTGDTTVVGDLGAVGTVSGFSTAQQSTADSATVLGNLATAYSELGVASPATAIEGPIGEMTLTPGVYSSAAALTINGPLILDASSDPDGVFIFQVNGALNTSANSRITMVGGSAENVYWHVTGAVTLSAASATTVSEFVGTLLAYGAVTAGAGAEVQGRLFSVNGAMTLASNDIARVLTQVELNAIQAEKDEAARVAAARLASITLGRAETYAVFAGAAFTSGTDGAAPVRPSLVVGNVGVVGAPTGVPMVQRGDLVTSGLTGEASVAADLEVAYEALKALPSTNALSATLGAVTLSPGVYTQAGAVSITGPLVLDAGGDANAVFVFQLGAALTVAANTEITIVGGGSPQNVYWQVLGAASLGADSRFVGSLLSKAAIASGKDASVLGRLLSIDAAVSLYSNDIDAVASSTSAAASTISQISAEQLSALTFGQASNYAAFSGAAFSNAGTTTVTGDVGSVGAVSGSTMTQTGSIKTADLASIKADLESLYLATSRLRTTTELSTTVGATILTPGVYSAAAALTVTGDLILNTGTDADAVFVFQVVGALDLPASAKITITGAGSAANVYWQVKGAVALGANSKFVGTVLSKGAVAAGNEATVLGRLISLDAAVALNTNTVDNVSIALAAASDKAASDKAASDKAASDKAASDKASSDKAASDKAVSDAQAASGAADADEASARAIAAALVKSLRDAATAEEALRAKAAEEKSAADAAAEEAAAAEEKAAEVAAEEEAASDAKKTAQALVTRAKVAAEAAEVRIYGPKAKITFALPLRLLNRPPLPNEVAQIAIVPYGPITGGDASRAAQY
jgi:hypothetical protein